MNSAKGTALAIGGAIIIAGGAIYYAVDQWASERQGPGSGDEVSVSEPTGPGSGDEMPYEPEPTGPGSGDEMPAEPTGPGSGDEVPYEGEPTGPGSGDEVPYEGEPTGPGSGDEVPYEPEPTGPGSGDVIPNEDEPSGPGSGEETKAHASCSAIAKGSTCIDYVGSFWKFLKNTELNCRGAGGHSTEPCPQPAVGGCNVSAGTMNEIIIWHYDYGGDPFTPDVVPYASGVCNANPMSSWLAF